MNRSSALACGASLLLAVEVFACVGDDPATPVSSAPGDAGSASSSSSGTDAAVSSSSSSSGASGASSSGGSTSSTSSSSGGAEGPSLFLFATSEEYSGNPGGIVQVDALCKAAGNKVRIGGNFIAWLGAASRPDMAKLLPANRTWYTPDGKTRLASTAELLDGTTGVHAPVRMTEKLDELAENAAVWTNILAGGAAGSQSCKEWSSSSPAEVGAVSLAGYSGTQWTKDGDNTSSCSGSAHFYCIEVP